MIVVDAIHAVDEDVGGNLSPSFSPMKHCHLFRLWKVKKEENNRGQIWLSASLISIPTPQRQHPSTQNIKSSVLLLLVNQIEFPKDVTW